MSKQVGVIDVYDVRTFDDLKSCMRAVLGRDTTQLLELAELVIRTYAIAKIPEKDAVWLRDFALQVGFHVGQLKRDWTTGKLEDGLGLKRPKKWTRSAVQREAKYRFAAYGAVARAIRDGAKTPQVFQQVYDSGEFPENVSPSQIEKWYFELKREFDGPRPKKSTQRSKAKSEKTKHR